MTIEDNGGFALALELIDSSVAAEITQSVTIPTIGIGSGIECDGQILVFHDLVGYFSWFKPKHAKSDGNVAEEIRKAARAYIDRTRGNLGSGRFFASNSWSWCAPPGGSGITPSVNSNSFRCTAVSFNASAASGA
jgi:hypothetical protein